MKTVGIICEYNPFHLGHRKQFDMIRANYGEECAIVCLMSGNFVQRGQPAIFDKSIRAAAAIECGADLVLELPVTAALSSAEGFAAAGVKLLSPLCDALCFGAETANKDILISAAKALLSSDFSPLLRRELDTGKSFPAARETTLEEILATTKSKRYTRTRLDRMMMCAFLGITAEDLTMEIPYTRVLAFNGKGRTVLSAAKKHHIYLNAGESFDHPCWALEKRCGDLYGLFCVDGIEPPGREENRRIYYQM